MANLVKMAQSLAALSPVEAKAVAGLVKFIKAKSDKELPKVPRKYTKKVKVEGAAPKTRKKKGEIDHSPRSVSDMEKGQSAKVSV